LPKAFHRTATVTHLTWSGDYPADAAAVSTRLPNGKKTLLDADTSGAGASTAIGCERIRGIAFAVAGSTEVNSLDIDDPLSA
jgi:hypothetical protein